MTPELQDLIADMMDSASRLAKYSQEQQESGPGAAIMPDIGFNVSELMVAWCHAAIAKHHPDLVLPDPPSSRSLKSFLRHAELFRAAMEDNPPDRS